jgi:hypothetical protein
MRNTDVQWGRTHEQIQSELLENVQRAKTAFQHATADNHMAARESYVRALDALNAFLRSEHLRRCVVEKRASLSCVGGK